ncbi:MAG: glycosyltransferase family 2 protein, partial [Candidatus Acidiferrales bacterium]
YNVEKYIEPTIQALLEQTRLPDEILIIDDASKDRTVEVASRYPVRVIRHESNKGLSAGRNTAFANARYELVAAIDADVTPEKDWLERLAENFDDPGVAGAGGRLIEKHRETPPGRLAGDAFFAGHGRRADRNIRRIAAPAGRIRDDLPERRGRARGRIRRALPHEF